MSPDGVSSKGADMGNAVSSGVSRRRTRRARASAAALWLVAAASLSASAPVSAQSARDHFGQRYQPLDQAERGRALGAARAASEAELRRRTGRPADAPLRVEVLSVERQRLAKNEHADTYQRRAEVVLYDYDADRRSVATVNLDTGAVESVFVASGGQPPLTNAEVTRAFELVLADPRAAAQLRADFARVASRPLRDPGELTVIGFSYRADSMPDRNTPETAQCGRHRCAQLLVRADDDVALELPIVDLSRERVLETRWFGPTPPPAAPAPAAVPPASPAPAAAQKAQKKDVHAAH
jgi:hypothetical protein